MTIVLEIKDLEVILHGKDLFKVEHLTVNQGDRIAIIGNNGVGKSTLLKIILGDTKNPNGRIDSFIEYSYLKQQTRKSDLDYKENTNYKLVSNFNIPRESIDLSGGELKKLNIVNSLSLYKEGLILDEPTTHLDDTSIDLLINELLNYYGTIIFVSHNRYFINKLATKIWSIEDGELREYVGNYQNYVDQKEVEKISIVNKYDNYIQEKEKLIKAIEEQYKYAESLNKKKEKDTHSPGRLGQSKPKDTVQKNAFKKVKSLEKRLEQLDIEEKLKENNTVVFPLESVTKIHNKVPIFSQSFNLIKGNKTLLENSSFQFPYGKKIAIIGENGIGKSSLLESILYREEGIDISPKVIMSSYNQLEYNINSNKNILEYIKAQTDFNEDLIRSILKKLDFSILDFKKKISKISGGEATRLALALVFLRESNTIILDEPTNFLDLSVTQALEALICAYPGTVIYTSHDKVFLDNTADMIFRIEDRKLKEVT